MAQIDTTKNALQQVAVDFYKDGVARKVASDAAERKAKNGGKNSKSSGIKGRGAMLGKQKPKASTAVARNAKDDGGFFATS